MLELEHNVYLQLPTNMKGLIGQQFSCEPAFL